MKRGIVTALLLILSAGAGAGTYYELIYKENAVLAAGERTSSDSQDAVFVNSVAMLAGLESGTGVVQRYAGVIEPQQTWEVKLENEKTVEETYVKEGDSVKVGDKLFKYKTTDDEEKLAQDHIDLDRLANEIDLAQNRIEQLEKEKKSASADEQLTYTTDILQQENQIKQNEYEIKTKELEVSSLEEAIKNSTVTCELDGVIKSIKKQGESSGGYYGSDSSDAYITVMAVGDFQVKCQINEQNINDVYPDLPMLVTSRVDASQTWTGVLTEIKMDSGTSNSSDSSYGYSDSSQDTTTSSTNYPFYVTLDSSDGLMLGQHVFVEADYGQSDGREGIWLEDYYFVFDDDENAFVWAANARNQLEKRSVTLGEYDEDLMLFQVLDGLDAEDYIASPMDDLMEGMPVSYVDYDEGDLYGYGDDAVWSDGEISGVTWNEGDEASWFDDEGDNAYYDDGQNGDDAFWGADEDGDDTYWDADEDGDDQIFYGDDGVEVIGRNDGE